MNININGARITLTKEQLEEINYQIYNCTNNSQKWKDRIFYNRYRLYVSGDNRIIPYKLSTLINNNEFSFKNEEHAELISKKCNLMIKMHNFAYAMNDGWVPDWENGNEKWGIVHFDDIFKIRCLNRYNDFICGISVKSEELAQQMLEEFGEEIKLVYNKQY